MDDVRVEVRRLGRARGEDGHPAVQRPHRPQAKLEVDADAEDEVADQGSIRIEPGLEVVRDEDPRIGRNGRDCSAASVEEDEIWLEALREPRALEHVRGERRAREPAACATAPDRGQTGEGRGLEMV